MGKQRQKTRVSCKMDKLPGDVLREVDALIVDTSNTYTDISDHLLELGYDISRSAVGRYAVRSNSATQRLLAAQQQTEALVNVIKQNPDADYTEAGMRMLMDGLINKLATAEEEFDAMPVEKAGRLITALSRTKVYKDKVRQDMMAKMELAFKGMEAEILQTIKSDPELLEDMKRILTRAKEKMMGEE